MRVLFSCVPSEGHFSPLLPLARALAGRGHEVAFAVSERWRPRATEEGFESFAAGPDAVEVHEAFEPERLRIFELPLEQRRPLQFSGLFGRMHAPAKLPELLRPLPDVERGRDRARQRRPRRADRGCGARARRRSTTPSAR